MHIRWRGLELPSLVTCDAATLTATYGKFVAEPFERGFGVDDRQRPAPHSALQPGRQRGHADQGPRRPARIHHDPGRGRRHDRHRAQRQVAGRQEPQRFDQGGAHREEHRAARSPAPTSQTDEAVEVINKDHVIATLTDDVPFVMEMVVENGRGYVPATEHSQNVQEIGIIPIDAVYSPVVRVRYEIEETRVGQKTNYDKLTMEIWTNGSIAPEMALVEVGQDSPQAPQSVRAVQRAGPAGALAGPRHDARHRRGAWKPSST